MTDVAYFDGACEPTNPGGTGGWGFVIYDAAGNRLASDSGTIPARPSTTNNVAEYVAARRAIGAYTTLGRPGPLEMRGDSKLVIEQMAGRWRIKAGAYVHAARDLRQFVTDLAKVGMVVTWEWIPRERNGEADDLSKAKLREAGIAIVLERKPGEESKLRQTIADQQRAIESYQRLIEGLEERLSCARLLLQTAVDAREQFEALSAQEHTDAMTRAVANARVLLGQPPAPPDPAWYAKAREVLAMPYPEPDA